MSEIFDSDDFLDDKPYFVTTKSLLSWFDSLHLLQKQFCRLELVSEIVHEDLVAPSVSLVYGRLFV
jgi:hypothetical protein